MEEDRLLALLLDSQDHSLNEELFLEKSNREGRRKSAFCASVVGSDERNADEYAIKISSSVLQFRSTSHLASLRTCIML